MAKRGRKPWKPTPEQMEIIEKVARLGGTKNMAATLCGVSWSRIEEKFGDLFHKKSEEGKLNLLELQHETAKTNPTLQIWLGKQMLGQTDKQHIDQHNTHQGTVQIYIPDNGRKPQGNGK